VFENKTIQEIDDLIISQFTASFSKTFPIFPKSFLRVLSKVLSAVFILLYKAAGWMYLQIFVSTASFKPVTVLGKTITPLIEHGRLVGVGDPLPSTQAELTILVNVVDIGSTLYAGTQFQTDLNDVLYITTENYVLDLATKSINVLATEGGTKGNLSIGNTLSLVNTLGIIENDANITAIITTAVDSESEDDYRFRVSERFQLQPQGGAYADYRIWAAEVPGVKQTYIYSGDPPSNVLIYVAGDSVIYSDRIPNTALLLAVANALEYDPNTGMATRRPIGAVIDPAGNGTYTNVKAITVVEFDVEVTGLTIDASLLSQTRLDMKSAVDAYMLEREPFIEGLSIPPKKGEITQSNVVGIVNNIVRANSGTFLNALNSINGVSTTNYSLLEGQLAKLGTFTVNGVVI
jgi:hypothetical protein